uniref:Uncharacterized protein n=1 Tax=Steinernema glaseri TaxID=37863 RepID=A0A1I7ZKC1_9BILA
MSCIPSPDFRPWPYCHVDSSHAYVVEFRVSGLISLRGFLERGWSYCFYCTARSVDMSCFPSPDFCP